MESWLFQKRLFLLSYTSVACLSSWMLMLQHTVMNTQVLRWRDSHCCSWGSFAQRRGGWRGSGSRETSIRDKKVKWSAECIHVYYTQLRIWMSVYMYITYLHISTISFFHLCLYPQTSDSHIARAPPHIHILTTLSLHQTTIKVSDINVHIIITNK